jgi:hypothetical protein
MNKGGLNKMANDSEKDILFLSMLEKIGMEIIDGYDYDMLFLKLSSSPCELTQIELDMLKPLLNLERTKKVMEEMDKKKENLNDARFRMLTLLENKISKSELLMLYKQSEDIFQKEENLKKMKTELFKNYHR